MQGNVSDVIEALLNKDKGLRDNDRRLISNVWVSELGGKDVVAKMTALEFLQEFINGKCTTPESITRKRRAIQEVLPNLRGRCYDKRQGSQGEVVAEVRELQDKVEQRILRQDEHLPYKS